MKHRDVEETHSVHIQQFMKIQVQWLTSLEIQMLANQLTAAAPTVRTGGATAKL